MHVTTAVPYLSTRLAGCSVGPRISRGARKLTRTPQVIKKKKKPKSLFGSSYRKNVDHIVIQVQFLIFIFVRRQQFFFCFFISSCTWFLLYHVPSFSFLTFFHFRSHFLIYHLKKKTRSI